MKKLIVSSVFVATVLMAFFLFAPLPKYNTAVDVDTMRLGITESSVQVLYDGGIGYEIPKREFISLLQADGYLPPDCRSYLNR